MHYIVGQEGVGKNYIIHLIQFDQESKGFKIWIQHKDEILLWKEFNVNMPVSIEYNINF